MDKKTLDSILKNAYNLILWRQVLTDVFGARNLNQTPQKILLPSNDLAENAFELGFFNTTDDRIIGFYQIDLNDKPQIWRNKVGLRDLLRNIYKYDVDGALVVFVQNDKWRLSFVSEIRVLNDDGTIDKRATEPKRYTYLLGKNEKTKTPTDRLSLLTNKKIALEDIRAAFSVEALNNEFYKQISEYFYQLVGATTTKGKKTEVREKIMNLPGVAADDRKTHQEFAVRLIGRTVFCWFLREKCSEQNKPLLPEKLLSSDAVRTNKNYYHEILEFLFFQTLNTPMDKRIADLPVGCETVPFLNGGLFEPQNEDFYNSQSKTGSYQMYDLKIPDSWFADFFTKLEEYNFTIDENSPTEVEISVDPEMLGRIFENLLAEIDPDSGETARKATGSFYTPREIVNYMVDESLLIYLKSKMLEETVGYQSLKSPQATFGGNDWRVGQPHLEYPLVENRWKDKTKELEAALRELFSYITNDNPFGEDDTKKLIKAIDECKILDPACGSGAFPIGVLQRLVYLLGKLDKKSSKWKAAQLGKIDSLIESAKEIDDGRVRSKVTGDLENRKAEIEKDFASKEPDFPRKLFLIEKCIYGVDIQPIAAEISKLRCFLTLIVDDTIDESAENRGVNPLPNLEFKFVTADALLRLPDAKQINLFNSDTRISELERIRHEYLNSFGTEKEAAKYEYEVIRKSIKKDHENNEFKDERSIAISKWNPFGHEKVDWFDSLWMFGVKAFDIVIGNPPYVQMQKDGGYLAKKYAKENYETFERTGDIYSLFYERSFQVLNKNGILTFITSNKWLRAGYGKSLRTFLANKNPQILLDLGPGIFESATVDTNIFLGKNGENKKQLKGFSLKNKNDFFSLDYNHFIEMPNVGENSWTILNDNQSLIRKAIESKGIPLRKWNINIYRGITTGFNDAFVLSEKDKNELVRKEKNISKFIKPLLRGRDIQRYKADWANLYLLFIPWHFPLNDDFSIQGASKKAENEFRATYPNLYNYFLNYEKELAERNKAETGIRYEWYALQRCAATFYGEFDKPKIIYQEMVQESSFCYDESNKYFCLDTGRIITGEKLKFLLAVLNSSLFFYAVKNFYGGGGLGAKGVRMKHTFFADFQVPKLSHTSTFENLVDYILFLKETDGAEQVNEYVPNSHLVEQFEEVIDALVYELYFEEDFQKAEIHFHKYATRDFPSVENLTRAEKIKTIHAAYQTLRQKDGEIRNNLKLMDIRLADLIMPIKTAR